MMATQLSRKRVHLGAAMLVVICLLFWLTSDDNKVQQSKPVPFSVKEKIRIQNLVNSPHWGRKFGRLRLKKTYPGAANYAQIVKENRAKILARRKEIRHHDQEKSESIYKIKSGKPIKLPQDDPIVLRYILDHGYLHPPSDEGYNLAQPDVDPSMGQGQFIRNIFKNMTGGFFVESGALDGETRSNSLYLEKELGWKGLLVEADPKNYDLVVQKKRKAWTSNSCLATKPYPHKVVFQQNFNVGRIKQESSLKSPNLTGKGLVVVQCFPIYSLLSALGVKTVDYFSLDVEGVEKDVLINIPFNKIFIKTLSVEFNHVKVGKEGLKKILEKKGYVLVGEVTNPQGLANDFIFVHYTLPNLIAAAKE